MNNRVGKVYRDRLKKHVQSGIEQHSNIFVLSFSGVSAAQMNSLRMGLKQLGAQVYVSKNRLTKLALKELDLSGLTNHVKGQTALVWGDTDSAEISKKLVKFAKDFEGLVIKAGRIGKSIIEKSDIEKLSQLPSKQVLQAQLLGTIQAPLTRLAYCLNAKTRDLLSIMKQLSEKKGGS